MPRREFPRKVRAAAFLRANGACEKCGARLKVGEGEVDHVLPDALGGEPVLSNAKVLCRPCHAAKSADDVRRVRKSDRQRDRHIGAIRPACTIKSRGFPKAERRREPGEKERQLRALRERQHERQG